MYLFARNLTDKLIFDKDRAKLNLEHELAEHTKHFRMEEFPALRDLMLLYDGGAVEDSPLKSFPLLHSRTLLPQFVSLCPNPFDYVQEDFQI